MSLCLAKLYFRILAEEFFQQSFLHGRTQNTVRYRSAHSTDSQRHGAHFLRRKDLPDRSLAGGQGRCMALIAPLSACFLPAAPFGKQPDNKKEEEWRVEDAKGRSGNHARQNRRSQRVLGSGTGPGAYGQRDDAEDKAQ